MIIAEDLRKKVEQTDPGVVLTPADFGVAKKLQPALIVALNRMVATGELKRFGRGKYYKERTSIFGSVPLETSEIVKDYLMKDNQVIGYITGTNAFARMGLTTQISSTILIGTNTYRHPLERGGNKVAFVLQPNPIREEDIELYVLLDALRYIQRIPATTPTEAVETLIPVIRRMDKKEQERLEALSLGYKPFVRAILGAIYEYLGLPCERLRGSLNGTTNFRIKIGKEVLPTTTNWRIL